MDNMKVNTGLLREQAQAATATCEYPYLAQVLAYVLNQLDQTGSVSMTNDAWTKQMFIEQALNQLEADLNQPHVKQALEKLLD